MSIQTQPDPRPFKIYYGSRGWPRWYQRWIEAWWVLTRKHSLHLVWQNGGLHGTRMEYERTVVNGGDLGPICREIVDLTWGRARMDGSAPSSETANEIIAQAWRDLREARAATASHTAGNLTQDQRR